MKLKNWKTEKLKNWKTEKLKNWIHMENLFLDLSGKNSFSVFQFFSFSVFQFFSFRNYFGIFPEKLKNWKTEFSRDIQAEILHMDSVFQFLRKYSAIVPETEKLKNWKTKKLKTWIHMENLCLHVPGKFSFSVFQFLRKYSEIVPETEKLKN